MPLRHSILAAGVALAAAAAAGQTVSLNGNMGERQGLLVIDGVPRVLEVGRTVQGVRLLSLTPTQAEVEVGGVRRTLVAGASPVRLAGSEGASSAGGNEIVLSAGTGGHFTTAGQINGKAVSFLVDTGASVIAMSQADAVRIGLDYKNGKRGFTQTANGSVPVHAVNLTSVRVGDVEIANVDAVILPAGMQHVLLGNSFLARFQMKRDNDTLRLTKR
jgi:aspartyl protease family protein